MGLLRILRNILSALMTALLVVMSAALAVQIFSRQVLNTSFSWVPELAQISLIAMVLLGSYVLTFDEDHIRVDFLEMYVGRRGKHILSLFQDLMMLVVIVVVVIGAYSRGLDRFKESFMTIRFLRIGYIYFVMLAGFAFQGVWLILDFVRVVGLLVRGDEPESGTTE